jgi:hypothetical protein
MNQKLHFRRLLRYFPAPLFPNFIFSKLNYLQLVNGVAFLTIQHSGLIVISIGYNRDQNKSRMLNHQKMLHHSLTVISIII